MKKKGFTLIELLVVVAIISLLSSIILANIKDIRDKAKARAFRAEVMQLITAIELYRADNNGALPGPSSGNYYYRTGKDTNGAITIAVSGSWTQAQYENALAPYINKFPIPFTNNSYLLFQVNSALRCVGDPVVPPYVIHVLNSAGFEDWPALSSDANRKCFSIK